MKEGWTYKKLGEVAEIKSGYTPSFTDLLDDGYLPYFKVGDMNLEGNEKYLYYTSSYLDTTFKSYPKYSIVFPKNGAAIATNKKRILSRPSVVDLNTAVLIANNSVNYEYLYYWICKIDFKTITRRGAVPTLDIKTLIQFPIPVPPLSEQERIVSELDLLLGIIEKKKAQLKEYDQLSQSIFYDMFGDPVTNEKGWEVKKLGECFNVGSGGTPSKVIPEYWENGDIPWIGSNMCQNCIIKKTDGKYITEEGLKHSSAKMLESGTVLVALVGATIGKVALLKTKTAVNQNIAYIKVNESSIFLSEYVYYHLMSQYEEFMNIGDGKFKMANQAFIKSLTISIPPLSLQQSFAEKIEAIEKQKALIKQSITEVETLFNSRMDYYFN